MVVKRDQSSGAAQHKGRSEVEGEEGRETENCETEKDATAPEKPRVAQKALQEVLSSIP